MTRIQLALSIAMTIATIVNALLVARWNKRAADARPKSTPVKREIKITGVANVIGFVADLSLVFLAGANIIFFAVSSQPMSRVEVSILAVSAGIFLSTI